MNVQPTTLDYFSKQKTIELYTAIVISEGEGKYQTDAGTYGFRGPAILFVSPFQTFQVHEGHALSASLLQFHGDFYCIEFHKPEVACNGLLFNNVFLSPTLELDAGHFTNVAQLIENIRLETSSPAPDTPVVISYLQLFLALSSRVKKLQIEISPGLENRDPEMEKFKTLIEKSFIRERSPSYYADEMRLTPDQLSKRSKRYFSKTPSELIQERVVLEAKKLLHLTRKSVKEVSFSLNFEDEHYFSRFFKKSVGISPQLFREKAGISRVAELST